MMRSNVFSFGYILVFPHGNSKCFTSSLDKLFWNSVGGGCEIFCFLSSRFGWEWGSFEEMTFWI